MRFQDLIKQLRMCTLITIPGRLMRFQYNAIDSLLKHDVTREIIEKYRNNKMSKQCLKRRKLLRTIFYIVSAAILRQFHASLTNRGS